MGWWPCGAVVGGQGTRLRPRRFATFLFSGLVGSSHAWLEELVAHQPSCVPFTVPGKSHHQLCLQH